MLPATRRSTATRWRIRRTSRLGRVPCADRCWAGCRITYIVDGGRQLDTDDDSVVDRQALALALEAVGCVCLHVAVWTVVRGGGRIAILR